MGEGALTREGALAWPNLLAAYRAARRGKRAKRGAREWFARWEERLVELQARLAGGYIFGPYRTFEVRDPKPRSVAAAPFEDRVVHHLICARITPLIERTLVGGCVACRTGLGGAAARDALVRSCHNPAYRYFAKCDVRRYFASVRHDVLVGRLERYAGDTWTRALFEALVTSWHTPEAPGTGIPIGNLTSQLFANVYLSSVDRFMVRTAGARGYLRYVDDMAWFSADKPALWAQIAALGERLAPLGLELHPRKTRVGRVADGVDFAGFVASPSWLRLRGATKRRALRHLAELRRRRRRGVGGARGEDAYFQRLESFIALAGEARARGLLASRGLRW